MFRTGKNINGRYVTSPGANGWSRVFRYYPQAQLAYFNAAILAELGEPAGTRIGDVFGRYTVVEGGWQKDESGQRPTPKKRPDGKRQVPHVAIERSNALRRRLLQIGDQEGAKECRKAIEELRGWEEGL